MDRLSPRDRSRLMSKIKGRNTGPERLVRSLLHSMGFRFRIHRRDLPGTPDIVLPRYKVAIQVHGCFWHRHEGCKDTTVPKSNTDFWLKKLGRNVERDKRQALELERLGWRLIIVWECETKDRTMLAERIRHMILDKTSEGAPA